MPIAPAVQDCETLSAILREVLALRADVAALANRLPAMVANERHSALHRTFKGCGTPLT